MSDPNGGSTRSPSVGGGGAATSAGILFEQQLGALFSAWILSGQPFDERLNLGGAAPVWIRFETEAPVDDILVATSNGGYVAIQAKTSASLSRGLRSPFAITVAQFVRHWLACRDGNGKRGWNRPLDPVRDRLVLAVSAQAAASIRNDLPAALRIRSQAGGGALNDAQQRAWDDLEACAGQAWASVTSEDIDPRLLDELAQLIRVFVFDPNGSDRGLVVANLAASLPDAADAATALIGLQAICAQMMAERGGADLAALRQSLTSKGIRLAAAPRYRRDIAMLRYHSDEVARSLGRYEVIVTADDNRVSVVRECQAAVRDAALRDSLLIVGEPGAGKTGVLNALARELREMGKDVLELAVDRYSVETLEGLRNELRLEHGLLEVLDNWDGAEPAWLIIDALDATRGGKGEGVFRTLIERVLSGQSRWRVVASIRTFDLRMGQQFRSLFKGKPPVVTLEEPGFATVRHIRVPPWSPSEFQQLLDRGPELAAALRNAPEQLRDLAAVPFNTRLLSELINDGVVRADLTQISSQAELLQVYWRHRVERHGTAARLCIQRIAEAMVEARALRAPLAVAAGGDPVMIDTLSHEGVIIAVENDRWVQFRHHLLFDFAASRALLNPSALVSGALRFSKVEARGLILAPALAFVLREIWDSDIDRAPFWTAVARILEDQDADPVIRSATSRICAEYPTVATDTHLLATRVVARDAGASQALVHVSGALAIRLEDHPDTPLAPWISLLSVVAQNVAPVAGTVRFLLFKLIGLATGPEQRSNLGLAARALLAHGYEQDEPGTMVSSAIDLVADTFATDAGESRRLLERVFEDARLKLHGWEDVPALCRKIQAIAAADPAFAAEMYRRTYDFSVTEQRVTQIGASQILSLNSTASQDYDMARYSLSEFFPKFLEEHPDHAIDAIVDAVDSYVAREHPISPEWEDHRLVIADRLVRLREDWSHVWAHDPNTSYGQDADVLVKKLLEHLRSAEKGAALHLVNRLIDRGTLAIFWSRIFMASAERDNGLIDLILPFASAQPFLLLPDTRKDAIDVLTKGYGRLSFDQRKAFESQVLAFNFSAYSRPENARKGFLRRLFGAIATDLLATSEARGFAQMDADLDEARNERLFVVRSTSDSPEAYHWIRELDRNAEANIRLMAAIDRAKETVGLETGKNETPALTLDKTFVVLEAVEDALQAPGVNAQLANYGDGVIGQALGRIVDWRLLPVEGEELATRTFLRLLQRVATSDSPAVHEDSESSFEQHASWGSPAARVEAAQVILDLALQRPGLYAELEPRIDALLADPHPAVRLQAALRLVRIWDLDRDGFWRRLKARLADDTNQGVLDYLISSVLGRVLHEEPEIVEPLALKLLERFSGEADRQSRMRLALSDALTILWITYRREAARAVVEGWIGDAARYHNELTRSLAVMRGAFVAGLDGKGECGDKAVRHRSHALVKAIVDAANEGLAPHFSRDSPSQAEMDEARDLARLLDAACRELYFSAGASHPVESNRPIDHDGLTIFFSETAPILERIGDYAMPHTVYYLIQLLEFLLPLDPARAFDLTAHALRSGGKRTGYQFESLGADLLVRLIGIFLADHKEIFESNARRAALVDCLEIFMGAGWPAARRLLYRLPELIQ